MYYRRMYLMFQFIVSGKITVTCISSCNWPVRSMPKFNLGNYVIDLSNNRPCY